MRAKIRGMMDRQLVNSTAWTSRERCHVHFRPQWHSVELGHDAFDLMAVAAGRGYLDKATLIIPLEVSTVNWTLNFQHCFVRAKTATNLP